MEQSEINKNYSEALLAKGLLLWSSHEIAMTNVPKLMLLGRGEVGMFSHALTLNLCADGAHATHTIPRTRELRQGNLGK